jgi:hypothetical protein
MVAFSKETGSGSTGFAGIMAAGSAVMKAAGDSGSECRRATRHSMPTCALLLKCIPLDGISCIKTPVCGRYHVTGRG